jgi:hypothetical protein
MLPPSRRLVTVLGLVMLAWWALGSWLTYWRDGAPLQP